MVKIVSRCFTEVQSLIPEQATAARNHSVWQEETRGRTRLLCGDLHDDRMSERGGEINIVLSSKGTMSEAGALQAVTISEGPQQSILSLDLWA